MGGTQYHSLMTVGNMTIINQAQGYSGSLSRAPDQPVVVRGNHVLKDMLGGSGLLHVGKDYQRGSRSRPYHGGPSWQDRDRIV